MTNTDARKEADAHDHTAGANGKMIGWALGLTSLFLVAEVVAGLVFNSLALLSDAAHMMTDVAALVIALLAIKFGSKPSDEKRTYGYKRIEVLAAAFNAVLLFAVAIYVLVEAFGRFSSPEPTQSTGMLIVAVLGLLVNLISMKLLSSGRKDSFNVKGAYLEVWADMLGSVGVIAGALAIRWTGWSWIDPVVAVAIGFWVLPRTWILLRDTSNVLLEGVPAELTLGDVRKAIAGVDGVKSVHDLHVWSTSTEDISLTAHVVLADDASGDGVRKTVERVVSETFGISHATIQVEDGRDSHQAEHIHP